MEPLKKTTPESGEESLLTTGEMAKLCDTTHRTVRFYEEERLIAPVLRTEGRHRLFSRDSLLRLQLALDLREAGLSIDSIRRLFALKDESATAAEATTKMSGVLEEQIEELQRRAEKLRHLKEELISMLNVIAGCTACVDKRFPLDCESCGHLERPGLPRAVRVLWKP